MDSTALLLACDTLIAYRIRWVRTPSALKGGI